MKRQIRLKKPSKEAAQSFLIALAAFVLLFLLYSAVLTPERLSLKAGDVAPKTITASKDVVDEIATENQRDAAEKAVPPSYISDESVQSEVVTELRAAFNTATQLTELTKGEDGMTFEITDVIRRQALTLLEPVQPDTETLDAVLLSDKSTLQTLANLSVKYVRETLSGKLTDGQEAEAISKIKRELYNEGLDETLVTFAGSVIWQYLRPNMFLDEETTQANRLKAREDVEDIIYKKGQNIVRSGEVVTMNQIQMLESLGMLVDTSFDANLYIGVALLLLLLFGMVYVYLLAFEQEMLLRPARIGLLCVIVGLCVALTLLFQGLSPFLSFTTLGVMLLVLLTKPRLAITVNMALAVLAGLLASGGAGLNSTDMFCVMFSAVVSGSVVVAILKKRQQRTVILVTGLIAGAVNIIATVSIAYFNSIDMKNAFLQSLWSGAGALLSGVFCIGVQPVLEWAFNLVTNAKLMELGNPNQPLLRQLLLEAPGTYHHSIIVANLAEAAASAVGANPLLARVGAYYHDIGKLKRPQYFKENQMHDNPHDRTDPRISAKILTSHPKDGVEMARKYHLPDQVCQIIGQHHGDNMAVYFYDKAIKEGLDVQPEQFRYAGPKPQGKEAAIVMLADTVEAAARAAQGSTSPEGMRELIRKLIKGKTEDGQLDECRINFQDIQTITDSFLTVLTGVYHERIEYPDIAVPARTAHKVSEGEDNLPEHMAEKEE